MGLLSGIAPRSGRGNLPRGRRVLYPGQGSWNETAGVTRPACLPAGFFRSLARSRPMLSPPNPQIAHAETRIFKAVFPNTTNHYDTLFGGTTLHMMDEVAFITATRFSRLKMVTVSSDKVDFTHPIPGGTLVELTGNVVRVELYVEQMYSDERQLAVTSLFTFVAVDEHRRPVPVRPAAALPPAAEA